MPPELRSDTQRFERNTLHGCICLWVEELGVKSAQETWQQLLSKLPEDEIIRKGTGNLRPPTLSWLFSDVGKGRGINRILSDFYDNYKGASWLPSCDAGDGHGDSEE